MAYIENLTDFSFNGAVTYGSIIWLLYIIWHLVRNFSRHEYENGVYKGKISFEETFISINGVKYDLSLVNKIAFISYDVKGALCNSTNAFEPRLSNGLDNYIEMTLDSGEKVKRNFLQTENQKVKYFKELLVKYHLENKISWLSLLSILEIEDYDDIQKFKAEIHK
tara:strand:+ start:116 stop:613 length:498 start_codon:yes stop_codon:yes gene_type:complete